MDVRMPFICNSDEIRNTVGSHNNKANIVAYYQVKTPFPGTVCDSGTPQVLSVDKCSCLLVGMKEDVHDHILHTVSPAGSGSPSQDADLCETVDPNTSRTHTQTNILTKQV